jgi:hypothetical protein
MLQTSTAGLDAMGSIGPGPSLMANSTGARMVQGFAYGKSPCVAMQPQVAASGRLDCVLMRIVHLKGPLCSTSKQVLSYQHEHFHQPPYVLLLFILGRSAASYGPACQYRLLAAVCRTPVVRMRTPDEIFVDSSVHLTLQESSQSSSAPC